jgi:hypothetical protein
MRGSDRASVHLRVSGESDLDGDQQHRACDLVYVDGNLQAKKLLCLPVTKSPRS